MIPLKTIEDLIIKHSSLEKDLSSGKLDKNLFAEKSKEYSDVNEVIEEMKKDDKEIVFLTGTNIKNTQNLIKRL